MAQDKMLKFLVEGLTRAFDKQEDCDVMFSVDGQTIGAHRLILNIHSQVLYEMAAGWTPDKDPIAIDDMSFDSFKALLRYMYSSELPLSNDTVFVYLAASTHLKIKCLEELCVNHIAGSLGTENVCMYMNEAVNFQSACLQEKCCKLFGERTNKILEHESFLELSQPALSGFLDADQTNALEVMLFHDVTRWMEEQCRDRGLPFNGTNMGHVIGNALYKIRFPTMTVQDFANYVTTVKGLLTDSEENGVFKKISVFDNEDIECPFSNKFRCQVSPYYIPFPDMDRLLNAKIVDDGQSGLCECSSLLNVKDQEDDREIRVPMHSFRFILQCCADLANSTPAMCETDPENQVIWNELHDEFLSWQDLTKSKNSSDVMTKYMQLRKKVDQLYSWSF